jgi:hypothetical protein
MWARESDKWNKTCFIICKIALFFSFMLKIYIESTFVRWRDCFSQRKKYKNIKLNDIVKQVKMKINITLRADDIGESLRSWNSLTNVALKMKLIILFLHSFHNPIKLLLKYHWRRISIIFVTKNAGCVASIAIDCNMQMCKGSSVVMRHESELN